jgi:hypothetical protein
MTDKVKWKRRGKFGTMLCAESENDTGPHADIEKQTYFGGYVVRVMLKTRTQREAKAWAEKVLKVKS